MKWNDMEPTSNPGQDKGVAWLSSAAITNVSPYFQKCPILYQSNLEEPICLLDCPAVQQSRISATAAHDLD